MLESRRESVKYKYKKFPWNDGWRFQGWQLSSGESTASERDLYIFCWSFSEISSLVFLVIRNIFWGCGAPPSWFCVYSAVGTLGSLGGRCLSGLTWPSPHCVQLSNTCLCPQISRRWSAWKAGGLWCVSGDGEAFLERQDVHSTNPRNKAPYTPQTSPWGMLDPAPTVSTVCGAEPETELKRESSIVLGLTPAPASGTDMWEGETIRHSLHRCHPMAPPSSEPGDAPNWEMPGRRGMTRRISCCFGETCDFQRITAAKIRTLTLKMTRTTWQYFSQASWNAFLNYVLTVDFCVQFCLALLWNLLNQVSENFYPWTLITVNIWPILLNLLSPR